MSVDIGFITFLIFFGLAALLLTGLPLTFCLGAVSVIFTIWLWGVPALLQIGSAAFSPTLNIILLAIPLFIFMANVLQFSGLADDLYDAFFHWSGRMKGGLAMGTVAICAIFAAMSGISGAATVSMGVIAVPSMLKRNYNKHLAVGCVSAGGALGILIPPSITMIIYASFSNVSVGKLFIAGILPGLLLCALFVVYIFIVCALKPSLGPVPEKENRADWGKKIASLKGVILPMILVFAVCGSIFTGMATPTEAAAVGAVGSLFCAAIKKKLTLGRMNSACTNTLLLSTMIIWVVIGATSFSNIYTAIGAPDFLMGLISDLGVGPWTVIIIMQATFFVLGMFMDPTGIVMITTPVYIPIVKSLGFDPIWFGILFIVNMEMGYITPPFGYNLFYMRSIVPPTISMKDIYISVIPFIGLQLLCLIIIMIFPQIALYLPGLMN